MNYENLTLRELQKTAEDRDLPTYGTKSALVDRLEADDAERLEATTPVAPEETETLPQPSTRYNPAAWVDGSRVLVSFQYNGRLTVDVLTYLHAQTVLHAHALGFTAIGTPGVVLYQGGATILSVEVN